MTERTWQAGQETLLNRGRLGEVGPELGFTRGLRYRPMHVTNLRTGNGGLNEVPAENRPRA